MFTKRGLLVVALLVGLFTLVGATQACCGGMPNYFIDVEIVGQPTCDYRRTSGRVDWTMNYRLPDGENMRVYEYGDGVVQSTDYYASLPDTPSTSVDTLSSYNVWVWQQLLPSPLPISPYKVRVQFEVDNPITGWMDWALIVFDCTSRGATNVVVHNGP
jgi:hypothetical protein